jgi:hypothetical protein
MASNSQIIRTSMQLVLVFVVLGLSYVLYISITKPYEGIEREREMTVLTRDRMDKVRTVLGVFSRENSRFPKTIDSLVVFARTDSMMTVSRDSLLGAGFVLDSLIFSPRTGKKFEYAVNDTSRVKIYLLKDPDSNDQIGSLDPDITLLNAANWQ